jgi:hypothetical protein
MLNCSMQVGRQTEIGVMMLPVASCNFTDTPKTVFILFTEVKMFESCPLKILYQTYCETVGECILLTTYTIQQCMYGGFQELP